MKRVTPPSSTAIDSSDSGAGPLQSAADALAQSVLADGFEQVVDRVEFEGVDGMVLVCGHEDDFRRGLEFAEDSGDVESAESGHRDVEENDVDGAGFECAQSSGSGVGGQHSGNAFVQAKQIDEFVENGTFVVDDKHAQAFTHDGSILVHGRLSRQC